MEKNIISNLIHYKYLVSIIKNPQYRGKYLEGPNELNLLRQPTNLHILRLFCSATRKIIEVQTLERIKIVVSCITNCNNDLSVYLIRQMHSLSTSLSRSVDSIVNNPKLMEITCWSETSPELHNLRQLLQKLTHANFVSFLAKIPPPPLYFTGRLRSVTSFHMLSLTHKKFSARQVEWMLLILPVHLLFHSLLSQGKDG